MKKLQESTEKLKEEIAKKEKLVGEKVYQVELEEERVDKLNDDIELEPAELEKELREKTKKFILKKFNYEQKRAEIETYKASLERLDKEIKSKEDELGDLEMLKLECKEKEKEYDELKKTMRDKADERKALTEDFEYYGKKILELTKRCEEELGLHKEEAKKALDEDIVSDGYQQLSELNRSVTKLEAKMGEMITIQENMNFSSKNQVSLKGLGVHSNIGSLPTSAYGGVNNQESTNEELKTCRDSIDEVKNQMGAIMEKIVEMTKTVDPRLKSIEEVMANFKNRIDRISKEVSNPKNQANHSETAKFEIQSEMKKLLQEFKEQITVMQRSVVASVQSKLVTSNQKAVLIQQGTGIQENTSVDEFASDVKEISNNGGHYEIAQYIFKVSSLFLNLVADLIKDNRNYKVLRNEIVK
jgi:chromosome segregation ATPase